MDPLQKATRDILSANRLYDWFQDYPWLSGHLGNPHAAIWFIGENPSLAAVKKIHGQSTIVTENLQWNSSDGDRLLREALFEAGLKTGDPGLDEGWRCYLTNTIKEPEYVAERNELKRDPTYWKIQAMRWLPILQTQIDFGSPRVLVALGGQTYKILLFMRELGLKSPPLAKIHHYSYIMLRPEAGTRRGPRHPERIAEFKESIKVLAEKFRVGDP